MYLHGELKYEVFVVVFFCMLTADPYHLIHQTVYVAVKLCSVNYRELVFAKIGTWLIETTGANL